MHTMIVTANRTDKIAVLEAKRTVANSMVPEQNRIYFHKNTITALNGYWSTLVNNPSLVKIFLQMRETNVEMIKCENMTLIVSKNMKNH